MAQLLKEHHANMQTKAKNIRIDIALYGSICVVLHFTFYIFRQRQSLAANITHMHNPFSVLQIYRKIHVFMQLISVHGHCIKNRSFLSKMERESQKKPRNRTHNFSSEKIVKLLEECSVERAIILSIIRLTMDAVLIDDEILTCVKQFLFFIHFFCNVF
jgi:hypothetical protein